MLAIVSGLFVLMAYFLRLERYLVFVPGCVVHGFTLGVAVIIMLNQLNFIFGLSHVPVHKHFIYNVIESLSHWPHFSVLSMVVFSCFLITLIFLCKKFSKIPAIILVSPFGILLGLFNVPLQTLSMKFGMIKGSLFLIPSFTIIPSLFLPALTIAVVSILETLISAKIADGITKTKHSTHKELLGLALANIGAGLFGGIPATAALARTTLNIKSGATHRISQAISSVCIAICAVILLPYFSYMPLAVIAAILVFVAIRMIETEHFFRLFIYDKTNFFVSMIVAFITVAQDPIMGIILGSAVSLILFMEKLSHGYLEASGIKASVIDQLPDVVIYYLAGPLGYINAQAHLSHFESHLEEYRDKNVVLNLRKLYFIDLDYRSNC
ncbi:SulP family inorganic anion transporter [Candidatus Dependentiae bacterium]|nr:SulP family inorganic anion transporter [Candidatus Dependentiae bacterium]